MWASAWFKHQKEDSVPEAVVHVSPYTILCRGGVLLQKFQIMS